MVFLIATAYSSTKSVSTNINHTNDLSCKKLSTLARVQKVCFMHFIFIVSGSPSLNVAFPAVPSSSYTYSSGTTIKFSKLKTNIGSAFSTTNYRFTAPSSGLYVFHWSISLSSSYYGNTNLMINGSTFHKTYCRKTYQQCGSTVTVWLSKSDQVWVESAYSSVYVRAFYSSFSGWRLH